MGVTYLLDTHVLLWLLSSPDRVREAVRLQLADRRNKVLVSAASAMEISTKTRLGKLAGEALIATWAARLADMGCDELEIRSQHALLAGGLSWKNRDPFDRLLVAQAISDNLTLVSSDSLMTEVVGLKLLTP